MGRTSDEEGETSTKVCKSDEIDDRPLKKARYVWQIKGKYHLKKSDDEKLPCYTSNNPGKDECSVLLPCKHSGCTDSICSITLTKMEDSDNSSLQEMNSNENEPNSEGCNPILNLSERDESNISKSQTSEVESVSIEKSEVPSALNTMLASVRPSTSWQLRKWQARQVARCFVDNTINRVLEDMGFVPLPVDADDILDEFPMTESENDEGLEDEAVLMAIHRHGLRTEGENSESGPESKTMSHSDDLKVDSTGNKVCSELSSATSLPCVCSMTSRQDENSYVSLDPFHHRPMFWEPSEAEEQKIYSTFTSELNNSELHRWFSDGLLPVITSDSSCDSDMKSYEESLMEEQSFAPENSSAAVKNEGGDETHLKESDQKSAKMQDCASNSSFEHSDFLDKAVAVAIKKKGLSKLSCADYS